MLFHTCCCCFVVFFWLTNNFKLKKKTSQFNLEKYAHLLYIEDVIHCNLQTIRRRSRFSAAHIVIKFKKFALLKVIVYHYTHMCTDNLACHYTYKNKTYLIQNKKKISSHPSTVVSLQILKNSFKVFHMTFKSNNG